ncbi:uncharacterized protein [Hyperolius riggenbachi]|uniref:uncharacterized protein n=1 Tax=Hyperolius riggenbachi TaxID=752182 RepID=UPI0035A33854
MSRALGASDRNIRDVISENVELKKFHEQMRREVRSILTRHEGVLGRAATEDSSGVSRRGAGRARPTRATDTGFVGSLKKQWTSLKQLIEALETRASQPGVISVTDHEKELTRLQKEVQELRAELAQSQELISQQQQLLQDQMVPPPGEGQQSPLWDAYFLEEQLRLQEERSVFEEQKLAFQDEREKFTEAAIRLGREVMLLSSPIFTSFQRGFNDDYEFSAADHSPSAASNTKKFTFSMSHGRKPHIGQTPAGPTTPSTAELYRVLRLAPPPSRSEMSHNCHGGSQQDTASDEDSSSGWSDSLSPRSASPELQPLPQYVAPSKLSMTPYLCPRATPGNVPWSHVDPHTPTSAEIYRALHLTPAESVPLGQRRRGDALWRSVLNHSHRRASLSKTVDPQYCVGIEKCDEAPSGCPYEMTRDGYEMDSSHSDDMGHAMDQTETPANQTHSITREDSEMFDNDSLYRVTPLPELSHFHEPSSRADPTGFKHVTFTRQGVYDDLGEKPPNSVTHPNKTPNKTPNKSKETVPPQGQCRSQSRDTLHPREASRSRSTENLQSNTEHGGRLRERSLSRDRCQTRSRDDAHRRHSLCHLARPNLQYEECQNYAAHNYATNRRRSLESLQQKHGHLKDAVHLRKACSSRSVRHKPAHLCRDSIYTSGPGRSPLHFHQSCPSSCNADPWTFEHIAASSLCADLLTQFLDCSF